LFAAGVLAVPATVSAATFTVNTTIDGKDANLGDNQCRTAANTCSLRAAVQQANVSGGTDTITLPAGTYRLDATVPGNLVAGSRALEISSNLTIAGAGAASTVIIAGTSSRVIDAQPYQGSAFTAVVNGVTVTGGVAAIGAGVMVGAGVTYSMTDAVISGNVASSPYAQGSFGGGVYVWGDVSKPSTVALTRVTINNNSAEQGGGVVNNYPSSITLTDSVVRNNTARFLYAGGLRNNGSMTLLNTHVTGNVAGLTQTSSSPGGAGIYTGNPPSPASGQRSSLTMTGGSIVGNRLPLNLLSSGGGLLNETGGTVVLSGVTVTGNAAFNGGGLLNDEGDMTIVNSTVANNTGIYGAGIYNNDFVPTDGFRANMYVVRSAIVRNNATDYQCAYRLIPPGNLCGAGGGVFNENGLLVLSDTTVAENIAATYGAGIYNLRIGTGTTAQAKVRLLNSTVAGNWAGIEAGGMISNQATWEARNTIVADNNAGGGINDCLAMPGTVATSFGNNISTDARCRFTAGSDRSGSAGLLPLADNGGPTLSMMPMTGSPVIGAGDNATCAADPVNGVDQRGASRPAGAVCDIGAVEGDAARPTPSSSARLATYGGGAWFFRATLAEGAPTSIALYGLGTDKPLMCDFDGDGSRTLLIVRPSGSYLVWSGRSTNSSGGPQVGVFFGLSTDVPICGDWNGDGRDTPGIVRAINGSLTWVLSNTANAGGPLTVFGYGIATDTPVVGDWNGDGVDSIGIARRTAAGLLWAPRNANSGGSPSTAFTYGGTTDVPVVGDWDGDGTDTQGVVRNYNGGLRWILRNSLASGDPASVFVYGRVGQRPLVWRGVGVGGV